MANPKINIASLDFDSIKTSLKDYLSTKSEFAGYDFNGSAFNSLLDVFAYNTLYYAFYSNLIGNEAFLDSATIETNIVSLLKPLGYVVPGRTASRMKMNVKPTSTTTNIIPYVDTFTGKDSSGNSYRFYALEGITLTSSTDIIVYEASSVVNNIEIDVNTTSQKAFIGNLNIDINTIQVKVNGETWSRFNASEQEPGPNSKIFFIDRANTGFYLIFGKQSLNDYESTYGKVIEDNDIVTVSYLVPSGTKANGIAPAINTKITVNSSILSANGTDSANLELIKFYVPQLFAANNRTVTSDDYYSTLLLSGILPAGIETKEQINVWGGDDADPPVYGRLFVSYADTTLTASSSSIKDSISLLNGQSVLTVLPEYVQAQTVTAYMGITASGASTSECVEIVDDVQAFYNTTTVFNKSINSADIKSLILTNYSSVRNVNLNSLYLSFSVTGSGGYKGVYFKNALTPGTSTPGTAVKTSSFTYNATTITLADKPKIYGSDGVATQGDLVALNTSLTELTAFGILGNVDYANGYVTIYENVIPTSTTISVMGYPKYKDTVTIKNELLLNVVATVTN